MQTTNLAEKLARFDTHWDPHVVADYNGNDVMVVKFAGEFPFHLHEEADDFFLVLEGEMVLDVEERSHRVRAGELSAPRAGRPSRRRSIRASEARRRGAREPSTRSGYAWWSVRRATWPTPGVRRGTSCLASTARSRPSSETAAGSP